MRFPSLQGFLSDGLKTLVDGPVAILLIEDFCETNSTIRHQLRLGMKNILVLGPPEFLIAAELVDKVSQIDFNATADDAMPVAVNTICRAVPGRWIYYGYNAEYLFYPFCESRTVGELTGFATEERRDSILTYVIDLYADDLKKHPNGVSINDAHLDKSGYYAHARSRDDIVMERQLDMFGSLRWRFEEHVSNTKRKIDRIGLFRAQPGLEIRSDHTFNIEEYNTFSCPWHHNITATICSFRAAKSLKTNPGSSSGIDTFKWHNSEKFSWNSQQLLDLGLMETGQWF